MIGKARQSMNHVQKLIANPLPYSPERNFDFIELSSKIPLNLFRISPLKSHPLLFFSGLSGPDLEPLHSSTKN